MERTGVIELSEIQTLDLLKLNVEIFKSLMNDEQNSSESLEAKVILSDIILRDLHRRSVEYMHEIHAGNFNKKEL